MNWRGVQNGNGSINFEPRASDVAELLRLARRYELLRASHEL